MPMGEVILMKNMYAFAEGFARVFDLFAARRRWPDMSNPEKKDYEALKGDWKIVGEEISKAIGGYAKEIAK